MSNENDDLIKIFNKQSFASETFSDMKEICAQPLNKFGLTAIEYARVHDDGTASILYSDPNIANYVVNKEIHVTAHVPEEIIDTEFWYIPPPNGPYSPFTKAIKDISNSCSLANFVRRHHGFYEMYCFWSEDDQSLASNKFFNMKESLEQYCLQFTDQAKSLITSVEQDRFKLTEPMLPNFRGLDANKQLNNVNIHYYLAKIQQELIKLNAYISPKLSAQELKCVHFLIEGKTAMDIAELLHLSHRTIEMHLNSIKIKLNCRKKSEIIMALINLAGNRQ